MFLFSSLYLQTQGEAADMVHPRAATTNDWISRKGITLYYYVVPTRIMTRGKSRSRKTNHVADNTARNADGGLWPVARMVDPRLWKIVDSRLQAVRLWIVGMDGWMVNCSVLIPRRVLFLFATQLCQTCDMFLTQFGWQLGILQLQSSSSWDSVRISGERTQDAYLTRIVAFVQRHVRTLARVRGVIYSLGMATLESMMPESCFMTGWTCSIGSDSKWWTYHVFHVLVLIM